jgi:hypothetical protein
MSMIIQPTEPVQEVHAVEVDVPEVQEPAPYRAWEAEEKEQRETPSSIPYSRFNEVNEEKKTYRNELDKANTELAKYREREEQVKAIKGPEDINIADYTDPEAYLRDLTKATKHQAILEVEERQLQKDRQDTINKQIQATNDLYTTNLGEAVKRNPDIKQASGWFDKHASSIHPAIAYELMIDENVGEVMHDIATNQDLVREMFEGDPASFIRKMHKMSARIDRSTRYGNSEQAPATYNRGTPKALPKDNIRESVPTSLRSAGAPSASNIGKAKSASEYLRMKRANEKR